MVRALFLAAACAVAPAVAAADIVGLAYDAEADELVMDIAYRGSHAHHDFEVQWGPCSGDAPPFEAVGRVLDVHGRDTAREGFTVRERIDLRELPCRPARVTLRLGLRSHASVFVPAAQASAPGARGEAAARGAAERAGPAENRAR